MASPPQLLRALHRAGFATLVVDLLPEIESRDGAAAFNTAALSTRLLAVTRWLAVQPEARGKRLSYLAVGTAAGAAFSAAAALGDSRLLAAIVALDGRPDLAGRQLGQVAAPSLLVVGRRDRLVLDANRGALRRLNPASRLVVAPSFRYLRYALRDPAHLGALLAVEWLTRHVAGVVPPAESRRPSLISLLDRWPAHGRAAAAATVLALLAALGTPGQPALAANSTITISGGALTYSGSSASSNLVVTKLSSGSSTYRFSDPNEITIVLGSGTASCSVVGGLSYQVDCPAISSLTLNLSSGNDSVDLVLRDSFAPTTVDGGSGTDSLTIDDSITSFNGDTVSLTGSTYDRFAINTISYSAFESLQVNAEPADNPIGIRGTSIPTTLNAGGGNDNITVGSSSSLDNIVGPLLVLGGGGTDTLTLDDTNTGTNSIYRPGASPRGGVAAISYDTTNDLAALVINAGSGADVLDMENLTVSATLNGGPGDDTLAASQSSSTPVNFVLSNTQLTGLGTVALTGIDNAILSGGGGNDTLNAFSFSMGPVTLYGNGGNDTLTGGGKDDSLDGGSGTNIVADTITASAHVLLVDGLLSNTGHGNDTLNGIQGAFLQGNTNPDTLDASGFNLGAVTLKGGTDNDVLVPSSGPFNDSLDGGNGTDTVQVTADTNFVLSNNTLTSGSQGTDALAGIEHASLTGGNSDNSFDVGGFTNGNTTIDGGNGTDSIVANANVNMTLAGSDGTGSLTYGANTTTFQGGIDEAVLTVGPNPHTIDTQGWHVIPQSFGNYTLTGGPGADTFNVGAGTLTASINGGGGNDLLFTDGAGADFNYAVSDSQIFNGETTFNLTNVPRVFLENTGSAGHTFDAHNRSGGLIVVAGSGPDSILAGSGPENIAGGNGDDTLAATMPGAGSMTLTNGNLAINAVNDSLSGIDFASLTGSGGDDTIDASAFHVISTSTVTILGLGGNDSISGSQGSDSIDGGAGTDTIFATAGSGGFVLSNGLLSSSAVGNDTLAGIDGASLTGGSGADMLNATLFTNGPVTLRGLGGDDTLFGTGLGDILDGGDNNDSIVANGGNDTIFGGAGDDCIDGGAGTDRIVESGGSFTLSDSNLSGFTGNDTLAGIDEASLTGGSGNDSISAAGFTHGPVTLDGAGGTDTLTGGAGNDCLVGGGNNDMVALTAPTDFSNLSFTLTPTSLQVTNRGTDTLSGIAQASLAGGFGNDTLDASAFTGPVTLQGNGGDDFLRGGAGNDSIDGGPGNDTLAATSDSDMTLNATSLVGGAGVGTDLFSNIEFASLAGLGASTTGRRLDAGAFGGSVTLRGGSGNDTLVGSPQNDLLDGGFGTDLASYFVGNASITLTGSSIQGQGNDTLVSIENFLIQGGSGPNTFDASAFNFGVELDGGGGNDLLIGSVFNDTLLGGDGNDTLIGKGGSDSIDGGTGSDMVIDSGDQNFTLTSSLLSGSGGATITGIEQAVLTGGVNSNIFNLAAFTGTVSLFGAEGDDTFILGSGGGTVDGGVGAGDLISMTADANLTLTDSTLTGNGSYSVHNIELANLSGGPGDNSIDASSFSGATTLSGQGGKDTLIGGPGNDILLGGPGDDSLSAGIGANSLDGGPGNDRWIESGNFNMTLVPLGLLGEQDDTVTNIESASLTGGAGDNIINLTGFPGPATVDGGLGNDLLTGGLASDSLFGNGGNDTLVPSAGSDTLDGGDGADQVYAAGNYTFTITDSRLDRTDGGGTVSSRLVAIEQAHLVGGDQPNLIDASAFGASQAPAGGQVTLEGAGGNDTLLASQADSSLDGGNGSDCLVGGPGNDTLMGGDIDTVSGPGNADTLLGNGGNDLLNGGFGNDYLDGGAGNDVLIGASGNDTMLGGPGDDTLSSAFDVAPDATTGNDLLSGGAGTNSVDGGPGQDTLTETGATNYAFVGASLVSGQGTDIFTGIEAANLTSGDSASLFDLVAFTGTVTALGGLGNDTFFASAFGDSLNGALGVNRLVVTAPVASGSVNLSLSDAALTGFGALADSLASIQEASLTGTSGPDTLNAAGFSGNATLDGGAGDDSLVGGHGDDCLLGGDGNDTLTGGPGANQVIGGLGTNRLVESAALIATSVQFTLTNQSLVGVGTDVITNTMDVLSNTVAVSLTGGSAGDLMDITAFTGTATLDGGLGDDTFAGGPANSSDSFVGGAGTDRLLETGDMNMLLTNVTLTRTNTVGGVLGVDTLASIDQAGLTGGDSANTIDASAFTGPVTIDGGAGDDLLYGGLGPDSIFGGLGNDTLSGGRGNDILDGGPGIDLLAESGQDVTGVRFTLSNNFLTRVDINGAETDALTNIELASLTGSSGADTLDASANPRPVTLMGLAGNDRLIGGPAADSLDGGDGADTLTGNGGNDTIFGGPGASADLLVETFDANIKLNNFNFIGPSTEFLNGIESASLTGGAGNNIIDASNFTAGPVTLDGAGGNDFLIGTINSDSLRGGAGDDTLKGGGGSDTLDGQSGTDRLVATGDQNFILSNSAMTVSNGANVVATNLVVSIEEASITGGLGDNSIQAAAFSGPVTLVGGEGNDLLVGGLADDSLSGGNGNDTLAGGPGNNTLQGGAGTDVVSETGAANFSLTDSLLTGLGIDSLSSFEAASLTATGGGNHVLDSTAFSGPATLAGGAGNDTLLSGVGNDYLDGGPGNDSLNSGPGNNTLLGQAGNDTLTAGPGNDNLDGGANDDVLVGGGGADTLAGGPGTDRLVAAGNVNFTLTDNSLAGDGAATLSGMELASLTGGAGDNNFDLQGWTGSATVDGGPGIDALSVAGTAGDDTPTITGGQVAFSTGTTHFGNVEHLAVFGGDGNDVFSIPSLGAAQSDGPNLVSALTDVTLSGGAGNDTFNLVPLDGVQFTVDGGSQPNGGADRLNFNAQGLFVTDQHGEIEVEGHSPVAYAGIEIVDLLNFAYKIFLSIVSR